MRLRKAQAKLERRIKAYEQLLARVGAGRANAFHRPGSPKKRSPKGRK